MNQYPPQGQEPEQQQPFPGSASDPTQFAGPGNYPSSPQTPGYTPPQQMPGYPSSPQPQQYQPTPTQQPDFYAPPAQQNNFPQGSGFQQPPYQQPYQQPPQYAPYQSYQQQQYQSPYHQAQPLNIDYRLAVAGGGAIFSLIAFFLPAYSGFTIYTTYLGYLNSTWSRNWLEFFLALVMIAIAALALFKDRLNTSTTPLIQRAQTSITNSPKTWYATLLGIALFAIFFHFVLDITHVGGWAFGSWLYFIGILAVAISAYLLWRQPASPTPPAQTPSSVGAPPSI